MPDEADAHLRIGDYVFSFLPQALQAVARASGREGATLLGYCTGGLFALLTTAAHQSEVRNLVLLASPMDYEKMGLISFITRRYQRQLHALIDRLGYVPGFVPSLAVDVADPLGGLTRYSDLFLSVWDHEYRKGRQALNHWLHDLVPGPRDAWKEFLDTFVVGNALVEGRFDLGDRMLDLHDVRCPCCRGRQPGPHRHGGLHPGDRGPGRQPGPHLSGRAGWARGHSGGVLGPGHHMDLVGAVVGTSVRLALPVPHLSARAYARLLSLTTEHTENTEGGK